MELTVNGSTLDRAEACRQLGLDPKRRRVLYVGNLLP